MSDNQVTDRDTRYAVVVMGMHRSGTSALAGLLARLGCDTPKDLMPATEDNEKGFYEALSISALDDTILASAGAGWSSWQGVNQGWFRSPKAAEFFEVASNSVKESFSDSRLIVLKDPRMCLLVPFWHEVLVRDNYTPFYLHTHRHPLEVASSLQRWSSVSNDRFPGYSSQIGQLLWLRYVLEAEAATRGHNRHFTSYSQLTRDWSEVADATAASFKITWPRLSNSVAEEIHDFLDSDLNHEHERVKHKHAPLKFTPWVSKTFEILERWAEEGESPGDHATLGAILEDFNRATPVFTTLVETGRKDALALQLKTQEEKQTLSKLEQVQSEAKATGEEIAAARIQSAEAQQRAEEAQGRITELTGTL
ncbi:sulfotransferase family protein, partial [Rhodobacteraceae bacterium W635]|uniref:sulfotransferase family protein n=1 Tax=Nioella halotolerans TaxID=2303578 RepID=UPI0011C100DA